MILLRGISCNKCEDCIPTTAVVRTEVSMCHVTTELSDSANSHFNEADEVHETLWNAS